MKTDAFMLSQSPRKKCNLMFFKLGSGPGESVWAAGNGHTGSLPSGWDQGIACNAISSGGDSPPLRYNTVSVSWLIWEERGGPPQVPGFRVHTSFIVG